MSAWHLARELLGLGADVQLSQFSAYQPNNPPAQQPTTLIFSATFLECGFGLGDLGCRAWGLFSSPSSFQPPPLSVAWTNLYSWSWAWIEELGFCFFEGH